MPRPRPSERFGCGLVTRLYTRWFHSKEVCSSQEFQGLCIPHVQACNACWPWEMNTCVQVSMYLGYKCFQAFPRGVYMQAWTQVFISQGFPSLYMRKQALKLFGTTKFLAVFTPVTPPTMLTIHLVYITDSLFTIKFCTYVQHLLCTCVHVTVCECVNCDGESVKGYTLTTQSCHGIIIHSIQ